MVDVLLKDDFFKEKDLKHSYDILTNVLNRETIFSYANYLINQHRKFSIMICDIDNFKFVNDMNGHITGDNVIAVTARKIKEVVKEIGVVGRYGGDEFVIIVPDIVEYDDIWNVCRKITLATNSITFADLNGLNVSFTIGLSRYDIDGETLLELFNKADKALYRGKQKGRNCFIIYLDSKHANIELKASKDVIFTSMDMHAKVANVLTYSNDLKSNIKALLHYLSRNLMIDYVSISSNDRLCYYDKYPLSKDIDLKFISEEHYKPTINNLGFAYVNNIKQLLVIRQNDLYELLQKDHIYSFVLVKVEAYGVNYGFIKADVGSEKGRIWQINDMDLFVMAAKMLGVLLYYNKTTFNELFEE